MNRAALKPHLISLEDFEEMLADAPEDERWELISGRVVRMMVGARWEHNRVVTNLTVALMNRFRAAGSPCRTLTETFRLKEETPPSSLLPDVLVYCRLPPPEATYLTDATVIIEVLAKGTARRDREDKWAVYQTLPSLQHYVLVTRDSPHVETIDRIDGVWAGHRIADGLAATLALPGLDVEVPLSEVYADLFD